MTDEEAKKKLDAEPDFAFVKRYEYSMKVLEERYPEGAPDNIIAQALMIEEEQVEPALNKLIVKMRGLMKVEL